MWGEAGKGQRPGRQKVNVVLSLRSVQDVHVAAHQPNTSSAAVSVRVGGALLYLHDWPAAVSITRGWQGMSRDAAQLPVEHRAPADMLRTEPVQAVTVVDVHGPVDVTGSLVRREGQPTQLTVRMGRLMLLIHDRAAYVSLRTAFREAATLSTSVLPRPETPSLRSVAMETAAKALAPPDRYTGRGRTARSTPTSSGSPRRGPTSARWLQ